MSPFSIGWSSPKIQRSGAIVGQKNGPTRAIFEKVSRNRRLANETTHKKRVSSKIDRRCSRAKLIFFDPFTFSLEKVLFILHKKSVRQSFSLSNSNQRSPFSTLFSSTMTASQNHQSTFTTQAMSPAPQSIQPSLPINPPPSNNMANNNNHAVNPPDLQEAKFHPVWEGTENNAIFVPALTNDDEEMEDFDTRHPFSSDQDSKIALGSRQPLFSFDTNIFLQSNGSMPSVILETDTFSISDDESMNESLPDFPEVDEREYQP